MYEKVASYEDFIKKKGSVDKKCNVDKRVIICSDDEKHQKVFLRMEKVQHVMCNKVLKNSMKEIDALLQVDHLCICKAIGYNKQEKKSTNTSTKK